LISPSTSVLPEGAWHHRLARMSTGKRKVEDGTVGDGAPSAAQPRPLGKDDRPVKVWSTIGRVRASMRICALLSLPTRPAQLPASGTEGATYLSVSPIRSAPSVCVVSYLRIPVCRRRAAAFTRLLSRYRLAPTQRCGLDPRLRRAVEQQTWVLRAAGPARARSWRRAVVVWRAACKRKTRALHSLRMRCI